ncbi:hypothetical protein H5410_026678 [Solanum commersonii]|uniref:Uncharacterized protein n=1 Tax=Solanum commersonii TaxID=4109 RepID=A0A9J5YXP9_SOLCO|nr:hypothetical protein H5410_026678 [Solanum commersonii]
MVPQGRSHFLFFQLEGISEMYIKLEGLLLISHLPSLRSGGRLVLLSSRKKYYNPLDFLGFLEWMLPAVTIESGYIHD